MLCLAFVYLFYAFSTSRPSQYAHTRWLADYLQQSESESSSSKPSLQATYMISGEILPSSSRPLPSSSSQEDGAEDSQMSLGPQDKDAEEVPSWQMLLAPAEDLERELRSIHASCDLIRLTVRVECKGRFVRIASVNVYSLSPSSLKVHGQRLWSYARTNTSPNIRAPPFSSRPHKRFETRTHHKPLTSYRNMRRKSE